MGGTRIEEALGYEGPRSGKEEEWKVKMVWWRVGLMRRWSLEVREGKGREGVGTRRRFEGGKTETREPRIEGEEDSFED